MLSDKETIQSPDSWPCDFALAMQRVNKYENWQENCGCITPSNRLRVVLSDIWDFDPFAPYLEYNSVEDLLKEWRVD